MKLKYLIANRLYSLNIAKIVPGFLRKILIKKENICFIPTKLNKLPINNHPVFTNIDQQKNIIEKFNTNKEEVSFKTYPNLINLLKKKYKNDQIFNFLDFGGEFIDQYLVLKKNFINIKYFVFNQKKINEDFLEIVKIYNYKDIFVLKSLEEVIKNNYDFINFGSVLQYVDNYNDLLNKLISCSEEYILVSGTHFYKSHNEKPDFVVMQMNLWPEKLFLYFFNFENFKKKFSKKSFEIEFEKKNLTHNINYDNFETLNVKNIQYTDILFKKK